MKRVDLRFLSKLQHFRRFCLPYYLSVDGGCDVGRIHRVNAHEELWFWGVSFDITHRKSYGYALSLEEAKTAFRAEYEAWQRQNGKPT